MSTQRGTGRFGRIAAVGTVMAMLLAAVALFGCDSMVKPGGPKGTGVTAAQAALEVTGTVKAQMIDVMKRGGITVVNPAYVIMGYASDAKTEVIVTGVMHGPNDAEYSEIDLGKTGAGWKVTGTK